jgi:hypothetical protein
MGNGLIKGSNYTTSGNLIKRNICNRFTDFLRSIQALSTGIVLVQILCKAAITVSLLTSS